VTKRLATVLAASTIAVLGGPSAHAYDMLRHRGPLPNLAAQGKFADSDINVIENLGQMVPEDLTFETGHHDLGPNGPIGPAHTLKLGSMLHQGKPVIVTLGYYRCPMLCNLVHEGLVKGLKGAGLEPGRDFLGLAVSVDPNENPKSAATNEGRLLRAFGKSDVAEAEKLWPFTLDRSGPDAPMARALATAVGFRYKYDEQSKQFAHAAVAFVLTPEGKISRYLYGVDFSPRDLRFALVEASGGRVGTALDRVLLTCFKYDPMTQRYTPFLFGIVRLVAGSCALALATLLFVLWRRELRNRRLAAQIAPERSPA
jgi:protein SCO1/2